VVGRLKKVPELYKDAQEVWEAFLALNSSRVVTQTGIYPITYSEIIAWLNIHEIEGDVREEYAHILRVLDRTYMEKVRSSNAKS